MIMRFFKRRNKDAVVEPPPIDSPEPFPIPDPFPEPEPEPVSEPEPVPVKKAPRKSSKKSKE